MKKWGKWQNLEILLSMIHHYDKVDEAIIVGILKKDLDDFLLFKEAIIKKLRLLH